MLDPHMSEEDLRELKTKHRNAERKEIIKAEMDYLKQVFDHMNKEKANPISLSGSNASLQIAVPGLSTAAVPATDAAPAAEVAMSGFDVSV